MQLNRTKCSFLRCTVHLLGHRVVSQGKESVHQIGYRLSLKVHYEVLHLWDVLYVQLDIERVPEYIEYVSNRIWDVSQCQSTIHDTRNKSLS